MQKNKYIIPLVELTHLDQTYPLAASQGEGSELDKGTEGGAIKEEGPDGLFSLWNVVDEEEE